MSQLPSSCQTEIYTQFIFRNFLWKFRRFFSLKMSEVASFQMVVKEKFGKECHFDKEDELGQRQNLKFPYYTFDNENYNQFMLQMMSVLEMRRFEKGQIIANEMDESLEVIFVEQGRYNIGYEINKKPFYRVRFGESTSIGGFQITFNKRYNFIYQAHNTMLCQGIRKSNF